MRIRIIAGIVGTVASIAFAIQTASPTTAAEATPTHVVGGVIGVIQPSPDRCIDCW